MDYAFDSKLNFASVTDISFSVVFSRSMHVVVNGRISFFLKAEWYSIACIYHAFFIHLPVDGHLISFIWSI